ncbi:MAG: transglutaminase domain-containing protein [Cyanothece sp. SIO1E1]|nr:transglutaminase domain-containing protein [Cyanothece sp. SIO1E1]
MRPGFVAVVLYNGGRLSSYSSAKLSGLLLLAALLRANAIPAGFCYQRLSIDDQGAPYSLHGFNAVYLPEVGWYRIDPRGNRVGINAQFTPPQEQLAYSIRLPGEVDLAGIFAEPLTLVIAALQRHTTWEALLANLPDMSPSLSQCR